MRVWLYYRLSRDEDEELNSLTNQRQIIYDYAVDKGYEIVGESFDDNVSGMHFEREGISKIYDAVENQLFDAILVKDLSRLGRHRTQTALFIDYLRANNVKVVSVTENIDTANENDDLLVGFKGLVNDFYARDISRKIRSGYRQKQKEGIIITAPFGYFKDKNTGEIVVVEDAAETVRMIFEYYTGGYGLKAVARLLTEAGRDTPATVQARLLGKRLAYNWTQMPGRNVWINTIVKRILQDEIYIGTLINHKTEHNSINKTFRFTSPDEQFRHENFVTPIVTREQWEQAQFLLSQRKKDGVRAAKNQPIHRYTGLIKCHDCGAVFVAKRRVRSSGSEYVEYTCNSYHRYGKQHCSPHRIHESDLDKLIYDELKVVKFQAQRNWAEIENTVTEWLTRKSDVERRVVSCQTRITALEGEIEGILMERIRDKANADRYSRMLEKRESDIVAHREQMGRLQNLEKSVRNRKDEMETSIHLLDEIIASGSISEAHLRMMIEKILISDAGDKLNIEIIVKADFRTRYSIYDGLDNLLEVGFAIGTEPTGWGDDADDAC